MMQSALIQQDKLYTFHEGKFEALGLKPYKNLRIGALINSKKLTMFASKLPLSLSKEQLDVQVELKMYQEGGLDPNSDYSIDYLAFPIPQENIYLVEAFAILEEELKQQYGKVAKKIGFIDVIFPRFLIYKILYFQNLETTKNHLFIYIGEEEAFAALYKDGQYIAYRGIETLSGLASKCGIEVTKLKSLLSQKGLNQEKYAPEEMNIFDILQKQFYENAEKIVYAINYKRSYFGFEQVDEVILDFEEGMIEGLENVLIAAGMSANVHLQRLSYQNLSPKESALALAIEYVGKFDEVDQKLNFTVFERKKPLYRYDSFWLFISILSLILLYGAGTLLIDRQIEHYNTLIVQKEKEIETLRKKNERWMKKLKNLKKLEKAREKEKREIVGEIELAELTLSSMPMIEEGKTQRQKVMNDVIEALYKYRLTTKSIDQNGTSIVDVDLVSKYEQREKIGAFIKYMLQKGYSEASTKEILKEENFYESSVRVSK